MKHSPRIIVNYVIFAFLFTVSSMLVGKSAIKLSEKHKTDPVSQEIVTIPQVVIDPGHGGEDGGASRGDVLEKNLNLEISLTLSDIFTLFGYDSLLTRTNDTLLYDYYNDLEDYTGKKKTYDLRNRLRIAEESGAELFIGIHMNKFPKEQYKGLQVYYSPNTDASRNAASIIQSYAKKFIAPDNKREIKCANQSIFILKRIKIPAVLVECGFLSNADEFSLLTTREYRNKLAMSIFASSAEYLTQK